MITALIVLIMLSAFFSASETAYSSLNMIRLKSRAEDGDKQAAKVLATDMRLNMALPCRISVYTENGKTLIGMITPAQMLSGLSDDPVLVQVGKEVEQQTILMIDETR